MTLETAINAFVFGDCILIIGAHTFYSQNIKVYAGQYLGSNLRIVADETEATQTLIVLEL